MATNGGTKSISPKELCHVVLKTTPDHYTTMVDFYKTFLGAKLVHASQIISFLTFDEKDHRIAILAIPGLTHVDPPRSNVGLAHVAFGFGSLPELVISYEQKKEHGILPHWCVNHGMTTSMYYTDPDGNDIETQVDNFDTAQGCMDFMESPEFAENPIGVDYDPEELVRRVRGGEDELAIKKRPNIGPRLRI